MTHLEKSIIHAFQFLLLKQRNSKNMTQYEFSKKCGFSRQYLSLVESGKRIPTLDFAFNVAEEFGMSVEGFIQMLIEKVSYYEELEQQRCKRL